jgi:membrane protein DedA with SNARE-associated domain
MLHHLIDLILNQSAFTLLLLSIPASAIGEFGLIIPILLESILLFAGFKISQGDNIFFLVTIFTLIGSLSGASAFYLVSKLLGDRVLSKYKFFSRKREEIEARLDKYSGWEPLGVGILRLTPGLLIPTTIGAGILEIPYWKFAIGVIISGLVYNVIFISLGFLLGTKPPFLATNLFIFFKVFVLILTLLIFFFLWKIVQKKWKSKD